MAIIITIYSFLGICLVSSIIKSRDKSKKALKVAGKALLKTAPSLLTVLGIVGLTLGILTPETISNLVGAEAGFSRGDKTQVLFVNCAILQFLYNVVKHICH